MKGVRGHYLTIRQALVTELRVSDRIVLLALQKYTLSLEKVRKAMMECQSRFTIEQRLNNTLQLLLQLHSIKGRHCSVVGKVVST